MNIAFRLKNHLLVAALAAAYPVLGHTAAAARVEFAAGNVTAISSAGPRPLTRGAELNAGETINTGDGRAQLRFADGAMVSLQPQTEFRIDDYNFSGKNDGQEKGFFSLLRGGLRTISGYIGKGNRDAYKVTTSVATIGIRGTEWSGVLSPAANLEDTKLSLGTGEGAIEVCNAGGCIIVASGESAIVTGSAPPKRTDVRPTLPPAAATNKPPAPPIYAQGEDRTEDGQLVVVETNKPSDPPPPPPKGLQSGQYTMTFAGAEGDAPIVGFNDQSNVVFDTKTGSRALKFDTDSGDKVFSWNSDDGNSSFFLLNDTIAYGVWGTGKKTEGGSDADLSRVHFVVGVPTTTDSLAGLTGLRGTYAVAGYTNPTNQHGIGTLDSSSTKLVAYFNGPATTLDLIMRLTVPVGGNGSRTYTATAYNIGMQGKTFGGEGSAVYTINGVDYEADFNVKGLFSGAGAKYAGTTYYILDGSIVTQGAVVFSKGGLHDGTPASATGSMAAVGEINSDGWIDFDAYSSNMTLTHAAGGKMVSGTDGGSGYVFSATDSSKVKNVGWIAEDVNGAMKAVLGWGRWTEGTQLDNYQSPTALRDVHYVVGTLASNLSANEGMTGTYTLVGGTNPTYTGNGGGTGTLQSSKLTVNFYSGWHSTSLNLKVKVDGATIAVNNVAGSGSGGVFSGSGSSSSYKGILAGAGGKYAGIAYKIDDATYGSIRGAAGYGRTKLDQMVPQ